MPTQLKRKRSSYTSAPGVTHAELALFCEEVMEKLGRLERCVDQLVSENERLKQDVVALTRIAATLEQRMSLLCQWQSAGRQAISQVLTLSADEMPVILLRWDDGTAEELS